MDRQSVYSTGIYPSQDVTDGGEGTNRIVQRELVDFIMHFQLETAFIYR